MIRLNQGDYGTYIIEDMDSGEDILVQTDYDFPSVAMTFGWSGDEEDIEGAVEYLDDIIGTENAVAEDPGYFMKEAKKQAYYGSISERAEQVGDFLVGVLTEGEPSLSEVANILGSEFPELSFEDLVNGIDLYNSFAEKRSFPTISDQEMADYFGVDPRKPPFVSQAKKAAVSEEDILANLGDVNYIDYGGLLVVDQGHGPEGMYIQSPEDDEGTWEIYRFGLEKPSSDEWFMRDLESAAASVGLTADGLEATLFSDEVVERALGYGDLILYHGPYEFDQYPLQLDYRGVHEFFGVDPRKPPFVTQAKKAQAITSGFTLDWDSIREELPNRAWVNNQGFSTTREVPLGTFQGSDEEFEELMYTAKQHGVDIELDHGGEMYAVEYQNPEKHYMKGKKAQYDDYDDDYEDERDKALPQVESAVAEFVGPKIRKFLSQYNQILEDAPYPSSYDRDFEAYTQSWIEDIAHVVACAEVDGSGDYTAIDAYRYQDSLTDILWKLADLDRKELKYDFDDFQDLVMYEAAAVAASAYSDLTGF